MSITVKFDDREYQASHGRAPKGRGSWAFEFEGQPIIWSPSMTLTDAKKWAVKEVRSKAPDGFSGTVYVDILP